MTDSQLTPHRYPAHLRPEVERLLKLREQGSGKDSRAMAAIVSAGRMSKLAMEIIDAEEPESEPMNRADFHKALIDCIDSAPSDEPEDDDSSSDQGLFPVE